MESCLRAWSDPGGGEDEADVVTSNKRPIKCIFLCRALIRPLLNLKNAVEEQKYKIIL